MSATTVLLIVLVVASIGIGRLPSRFAYVSESSKRVIQVVISVSVLALSLYITLSTRYAPQEKYWAYGAAGTILGFSIRESK
jgi:hypothetical protein